MTYLITWSTIVFGVLTYAFIKRDSSDAWSAIFWSGFALLMHAIATS